MTPYKESELEEELKIEPFALKLEDIFVDTKKKTIQFLKKYSRTQDVLKTISQIVCKNTNETFCLFYATFIETIAICAWPVI